jgi:hypothetical protein
MNMIQKVCFDDAATSAMGEAFDQVAAKFRVCRACDYRGSDHYSR